MFRSIASVVESAAAAIVTASNISSVLIVLALIMFVLRIPPGLCRELIV